MQRRGGILQESDPWAGEAGAGGAPAPAEGIALGQQRADAAKLKHPGGLPCLETRDAEGEGGGGRGDRVGQRKLAKQQVSGHGGLRAALTGRAEPMGGRPRGGEP